MNPHGSGEASVTQETEQPVKKFVHQTLGTALDKITLDPQKDRLRIEVPEGNFDLSQVMDVLKPRLDNAYYVSVDSRSVELFEPPEQAEAAGRLQCSGHKIMADIAARVAAEEAALLQSVRKALPGASEDFHQGLKTIMQEIEPTDPRRFIGGNASERTPFNR